MTGRGKRMKQIPRKEQRWGQGLEAFESKVNRFGSTLAILSAVRYPESM